MREAVTAWVDSGQRFGTAVLLCLQVDGGWRLNGRDGGDGVS
jgi:hypothetical protein